MLRDSGSASDFGAGDLQVHAPLTLEPGESTEPGNGPSPDITIEPDSTPGFPQLVKATVGYTPDWKEQGQVVATVFASLRGDNSVRKQIISLDGILDDHNKGITGPGHCSE